MDLSRFPRRQYTHAPTPIDHAPRFSKALAASCPGGVGPDIWIKRDDMLGLFPGGNKTRKLEFLAADALAQGADTLITCGAPQSNHCRITLAAAVVEGLRCQFVIEERVPGTYKTDASGNNFMFHLLGVENITLVPAGTNMAEAMGQIATALQAQGRKGYIIPGGGSNALGALGYVTAALELADFVEGSSHYHAWVDAIVDGHETTDNFAYAGPLTEAVQLGNVASRFSGVKLDWDVANMKFPGKPEAEALLTKSYRKGWELIAADR